MSVTSRAGVLPKAVVAALVGTVAGGTAAVWSLRQPSASAKVPASTVVAPTVTRPTTDSAARLSPSTSLPKQVPPATEPARAPTSAASRSTDDDANVLQRARTLARRPDVTALIALRDDVVRRATERGTTGSSTVKGELDEIDVRLNEARMLQLKLDADELRKTDSKSPR